MKIFGLNEINDKEFFHGLLAREDVFELLRHRGDFVARISEPVIGDPQSIIISVLVEKTELKFKGIKHYVIACKDGKFHLGGNAKYNSIAELIQGYRKEHNFVHGVKRKWWELKHSEVKIMEKIGEGIYGEVSKGIVAGKPVAVKQNHMNKLHKFQIREVMTEARHMRRLRHPHIIKLVGIAALSAPLLIVMELASDGSLDSYLKKNGEKIENMKKAIMCQQISWALIYLKQQNILHRDMAARNCLYDNGNVVIADFGKSQPGPSYKMDPGERLPIRWLSPETINNFIYDYASEVWSFGVCCYEIFNNGVEPYKGKTVPEVHDAVSAGLDFARLPESVDEIVRSLVNEHILVNLDVRQNIEYAANELEKYTKVPNTCKSGVKSEAKKRIKSEKLSNKAQSTKAATSVNTYKIK